MFPEGSPSTPAMTAPFLAPDDSIRLNDLLKDYELGGIALNDPSEGMQYQVWYAYYNGTEIRLHNENGYDDVIITSDTVTELSLTFDQNMRPAIAYMDDGQALLQWYDSQSAALVTTPIPGATSPMLSLDTKRTEFTDISDIILVYLKGKQICCRVQRDRFTIEYIAGTAESTNSRIVGAGMNKVNRFQILVRTIK